MLTKVFVIVLLALMVVSPASAQAPTLLDEGASATLRPEVAQELYREFSRSDADAIVEFSQYAYNASRCVLDAIEVKRTWIIPFGMPQHCASAFAVILKYTGKVLNPDEVGGDCTAPVGSGRCN